MNIILQHFDGELRELDKLSMANIQQYAEQHGAEYRLITGKPFREHLTSPCQKVHMLDEEFDEYDKVLMLDIDMFAPKHNDVNIFDKKGIGLYGPTQKKLHKRLVNDIRPIGTASIFYPYWGGAIYLMDRATRQHLRRGLGGNENWMSVFNVPYQYEDEGIMHFLATKTKFNKYPVPYLNQRWCCDSYAADKHLYKSGFIHIRTKIAPAGPKRDKIENYNLLVERGII